MSYVPDSSQLRGLPYEAASLYGMPHLGCRYYRDADVDATEWDGTPQRCAACGRRAANRHHEPPKGRGRTFLLRTPMGAELLKPALIALCGSGTTGCHGKRHSGLLRVRWEWDTDADEEAWWSGQMMAHGMVPHSPALFAVGQYRFDVKDGDGWRMSHYVRGWE